MKTLFYYIDKISKMTFKEFLYTFYSLYLKNNFLKAMKLFCAVFSPLKLSSSLTLTPFFKNIEIIIPETSLKSFEYVCEKYCSHYFDLLGSGWIKNSFAENSFGLMGYKYPELVLQRDSNNEWLKKILSKADSRKAAKIYEHISKNYLPIDWQKDFKSGCRWSAKTWYLDLKYGDKIGVDIKVPWELSRLQHLTRIAIFYSNKKTKNDCLINEYKNQLMDFIAQNPPLKGVNWRCTMDVGIRTANMALSYSIMKSSGAEFDSFFEKLFAASIYSHCNFIYKNLEWSATCRSNHYLSDICGLLFGAALLSDCPKKRKWLRFARKEIENELFLQFNEDGSNFEASVAYHRLSAELITYSVALINKLSADGLVEKLPQKSFDRIYRIGKFSYDTLLPDGTLYQCGDNDSGRFFNITPIGEFTTVKDIKKKYLNLSNYNCLDDDEEYFDETVNCVDGLLCAVNQLIGSDFLVTRPVCLEGAVVNAICPTKSAFSFSETPEQRSEFKNADSLYSYEYKSIKEIPLENISIKGLRRVVYPNFGLTIFRSKDLFFAICWSQNGQNGNAGHTHNDKLSFELWLNNTPVFRDPGTFVYTALPDERNRFRSVTSHSALITKDEQNKYLTMFSMEDDARCSLLECSDCKCSLLLRFGNTMQKREFTISNDCIIIKNESNVPFEDNFTQNCLATGYGKLINLENEKND